MCLYCDPSFIQNFEYDVEGFINIDFNYNVCYQIQRRCYKYIEFRSLASLLKNLVYMLEKLYENLDVIDAMEAPGAGFDSKLNFAMRINDV